MSKMDENNRLINRIVSFKFTSIDDGIDISVKWFVENYGKNITT